MNNLHRYARARADLYKYAFMDRISAGLLDESSGFPGKKKDTTQPFNGIRFTSHPRGTYDLNNHLAAQAEHAAVKHAVHTAGLVPKRQVTEDRQEYDRNVDRLTHTFVRHIRQHVHGNPNDQLTNYYLRTADKMKVPDDPSLPKTPGQPLEYHAPLPVGVRDLSTAVMPLVRMAAEDLNLRPKSTVLLPEEPSHLPKAGDELDLDSHSPQENFIDLLDPQFDEEHPDATEHRMANEFHKTPDVGARRLGEFGSGKPAYEVLSDPSEQDFNFEMPQVEGLEGPTPEIQEIESHKPRAPRAKPNVIPAQKRQEMYQAIADTMKNSPISGLSERVVKMLKEAYGLSARQANSMFESYKKVGMGNKGQKPTGRKTVPEDKYGLSRRGPSPRKFGAREVEYGSEAAKFGSHLVSQAMGEDQTSLIPLVDHLYEHEHPAAELIQRIQQGHPEYTGNLQRASYMGTPGRENSNATPVHRLFNDSQHRIRLNYIHLPNNRHYMGVSLENHPDNGYEAREYMLPVTLDYVTNYINHLSGSNQRHEQLAAKEWHRALTNEPNPDQHDGREDTFLREQEANIARPRDNGFGLDDPNQSKYTRLARVRYAAYRAPAGGMAVRGTFYKGGSLIPDMEGSFMKPKSKLNPAKLSALKARMRMSNSKI